MIKSPDSQDDDGRHHEPKRPIGHSGLRIVRDQNDPRIARITLSPPAAGEHGSHRDPASEWTEDEAAEKFSEGLAERDLSKLESALDTLAKFGTFDQVIRTSAHGLAPDKEKLRVLLSLWNNRGLWKIPRALGADLYLFSDLLRYFAPQYSGPSKTLYRGQSLARHAVGQYGIAWTTRLDIAKTFAQLREDVGVVLMVEAKPEMIIAHLPQWISTPKTDPESALEFEDEYILDPKDLRGRVVTID